MTDEDEFGQISEDADILQRQNQNRLQHHPDFTLFEGDEIRQVRSNVYYQSVTSNLPEQKDPCRWKFVSVQLRPDISWEIIKDLMTTVCMSKQLVPTSEFSNSVAYMRRMLIAPFEYDTVDGRGDSMDNATLENQTDGIKMIVYVQIGVLPSKLRILTICTTVMGDGNFFTSLTARGRFNNAGVQVLDNLVSDLQKLFLSQYIPLSCLNMEIPENTACTDLQGNALDELYANDVRRMYQSEMKENLRGLCIPLEQYVYEQEYSCALLLGILDPLLKKYSIDINSCDQTQIHKQTSEPPLHEENLAANVLQNDVGSNSELFVSGSDDKVMTEEKKDEAIEHTAQIYGEIVTMQVAALWAQCECDCDAKLKEKIREKKKQVSVKVASAQRLRRYAIESIAHCERAEVTTLRPSQIGDRLNILLYECTCMINNLPAKLHVTYGGIIYQTMIPFFSKTYEIPMAHVNEVNKGQVLGIQMIFVTTKQPEKVTTIAKGIEIDLLYELLQELYYIHSKPQEWPTK